MNASLRDRQIELEQEAVMLGKTRYSSDRALPWADKAGTADPESDSLPGQRMLKQALEPTAYLIVRFIESAGSGKAGRKHSALPYLCNVDPLQAAYLAARGAINGAAGNRRVQAVALAIASSIEDHLNIQALAKEKPGLYRKVSDQLKSSTSATHRLGVYRHVIDKYGSKPLSWSVKERVLLGSKLLELFMDATDMVKIELVTEGRHNTPQRVQFTEEWAAELEKGHSQCALLSPVHLPMIHPPKAWRHPYSGGYLSDAIRVRLVQTRSRAYLDELGSLDLGPVLDAVNTIQSTAWRINRKVLEVMTTLWDAGIDSKPLPSRHNIELPPRPSGVPTDVSMENLTIDQQERLKEWKARASKVHAGNAELRNERVQVAQKLWVARRFAEEAAIYFPHYLDFRGRVYPLANYLNPQGDDTAKGLLEFAEGKPLGEDGAYWLAVHIANLFGVDKVAFDDRVQWVFDNTAKILDSAVDPIDGECFWQMADKPFQALAACFEWASFQYNGDAHVSHLPVAMDGSCSGLQHFSALLRDEVGGAAVNLIPQDTPADIYTAVAKRAQVVSDASATGYASTWAGKVCRKVAKQPTMTLCYSATKYGMQLQIEGALKKLDEEHGRYLNDDTENHHASVYMADIVWNAIGDVVVAARSAMDWLQTVATVMAKGDIPIRWTTPMGLPVLQAYKEMRGEKVKVFVDGQRVMLSVTTETTKIHGRRQASSIAPNFVHSLDSAHLMRTASLAEANGIRSICVIHDSFATHACNTSTLNAVIREAFVQQYTGNLLEEFRDEVVAQIEARRPDLVELIPPLPALGNLDLAAVRNSDFFFA